MLENGWDWLFVAIVGCTFGMTLVVLAGGRRTRHVSTDIYLWHSRLENPQNENQESRIKTSGSRMVVEKKRFGRGRLRKRKTEGSTGKNRPEDGTVDATALESLVYGEPGRFRFTRRLVKPRSKRVENRKKRQVRYLLRKERFKRTRVVACGKRRTRGVKETVIVLANGRYLVCDAVSENVEAQLNNKTTYHIGKTHLADEGVCLLMLKSGLSSISLESHKVGVSKRSRLRVGHEPTFE